ncbi:hypothetical protein NC652_020588 [Populus alba x Populus x berolinensis]|uniref:Uncharacterized protein n=1 Tax=Populus alba x Populus x berolinensis TaxID=444605 RepID=A0AAD6QCJ1_9ROSI|nr:hypothetical protein NC652_020588 [Populus alba x Populus x berolinensis]KAJ6987142.1 hypothetical protein NC653_020388 [Populus alba x Populus x berolinensis]
MIAWQPFQFNMEVIIMHSDLNYMKEF